MTYKNNKMKIFKIIFLLFIIISCDDLSKASQDELIARVNNNYLYKSDIDNLNIEFSSSYDSIIKVKSYINTWAKNYLFYEKALLNISISQKQIIDKLINNYKFDIYNNTYKENIVKYKIDTIITENQLIDYYKRNFSNFLLKEPLYKIRFIGLPRDNIDRKFISNRFTRFSKEDKVFLDSISFQFTESFLNDSIWINKKTLLKIAPFINPEKVLSIKKPQYFQFEQSLQLYLFKIEDYLKENEVSPFSHIKNSIRNLVFNQRKFEFLKKFDQDIINDAIENKKFEIYK
ncbi:MAG: hypothetical protein CMC67_02650 [Flavobacteriaceae bacterium]|nr:hypothetical protein [Flavobacteriaceae bacterium]